MEIDIILVYDGEQEHIKLTTEAKGNSMWEIKVA